jgi:hypothetical protein
MFEMCDVFLQQYLEYNLKQCDKFEMHIMNIKYLKELVKNCINV